MISSKKIGLLLLCLLFACGIQAQRRLFVRGYVVDSLQRGIVASVAVEGTTLGTFCNEQGFYEIGIPEQDSITLIYSCVGYATRVRSFKNTDEKSYNITVTLKQNTETLQDVEIRALARQTSTMMRVNTDQFRAMPDPSGGGIETLIKSLAGVSSTSEISSQYSVRGGSFDENSVYVNGIEVYRPLLIRAGQQEGLSFINPDMVSSVDFSAGGFPAQYGDKMSSVLSVTYKKPTKFEGSVSLSLLGATAYVGSASKRFTQVHGIRYKSSQYLLGTMQTRGDYANWFVDYQTYMTYQLAPKWEMTFLGNFSQNSYRFIPRSRATEFGIVQMARELNVDFNGIEDDSFRTYFGTLGLNFTPKERVKLSFLLNGYNTTEKETYDIIGQYSLSEVVTDESGREGELLGEGLFHEHARNHLNATVFGAQHIGEAWWKNVKLQWGVGLQQEIIRDSLREWEYRDSASYAMPYNPTTVEMIYNLSSNNRISSTRFTGYLQDTYQYDADYGLWTFVSGVRVNYWSYNGEWLFSPRGSVTLFPKWKHDFNFRLAAGLYYQAPFYKEMRLTTTDASGNSSIVLNQDIRAQRSFNLVFGYDYFFRLWNRPFKFTTELYYKPSDRVISYSVDNVRVRYSGQNDAVAYTVGADVKLYGEFVPGTDSWISFSWMQSKENLLHDSYRVISNTGRYLGTIEPGWISRPNEQRYSISLYFQDYVPNNPEYKVHLRLIWADGLPFGAPRSQRYEAVYRTQAYRRVDIGASRGFVKGREKFMDKQNIIKAFWLNVELFNLFNIKNTNSYYWISDLYNQQYAVPNYLTQFMVNVRVSVDF